MTILNWSFPRKDITRQAQAFQLALAIREEVADLEKAGCKVIQVRFPLVVHVCCAIRNVCYLACNGAWLHIPPLGCFGICHCVLCLAGEVAL